MHPHVLKLAAQDKPTRAGPLRAMMMSGRVHSTNGSWQPALENELIAFPLATGNGVDDQVDALALLPRKLGRAATPIDLPQTRTVNLVGGGSVVPAHFAEVYA